MYYVYALKSRISNRIYIGFSRDLRKRFKAHNDGEVRSTRGFRPWQLIYYEAYYSKSDATKREVQLKRSNYKEELKSRLQNSLDEIRSRSQVG